MVGTDELVASIEALVRTNRVETLEAEGSSIGEAKGFLPEKRATHRAHL